MASFSSFDGLILEIPGISVDNFEHPDRHAYFLSHCHTDHTQGLSSLALMRHLEDHDVSIYMSDVTAAIIAGIPCYDGVKKYIRPLKLGSTTVIKLPVYYEDLYLEVTLIPASHCFGSVMFLLRTTFHTILFTGDFRISLNDVSKLGQLHTKSLDPIVIDKMYVDTTFLNCDYDIFPKRSESIESVILLVKEWLEKDERNAIALHPSARFGYEYVFNEIFTRLGLKVFVHDGDWSIYRKCLDKVPGVTDEATRIHKCKNRSDKNYHNSCAVPDTMNYLFIHLSAMKWTNYNTEFVPFERQSESRVDVCFATHCSRNELVNFVSYFSPKCVVGFPNPYVAENEADVVKVVFKPQKRRVGGVNGSRKKAKRD